ncbi:MAG TPA: alpha/beta fold hydrolase [Streptosporangiaceae bacterium]
MVHSAGGYQRAEPEGSPPGNTPASVAAWFGRSTCPPGSTHLLFCLPLAGGGASLFATWQRVIGTAIEVLPIQLPGREARFTEPVSHSPDDIAAAVAVRANRPYAIYGHSMGGRLGFEVIRSLSRIGAPLPVRFYPAAARPPDHPEKFGDISQYGDDEFLDALAERLGAPNELRDQPELRDLLLPLLRADFDWVSKYRPSPGPPLPVPFVAIAGADDSEPTPQEMQDWARYTAASFRQHTLPGGHFFLRTATRELVELIRYDLLT